MTQPIDEIDQTCLLDMAKDLDRFSRRFERFFTVQLEQFDTAARKLEREKEQWQRQRTRDLKQIEENRRALAEAWEHLKQGHGAEDIEAPDMASANDDEPIGNIETANAPLRLRIKPAVADEMVVGKLFLNITRLCRACGGNGARFELHDCRATISSKETLIELHVFPASALRTMELGEISDEVSNWKKFKSLLMLLPVSRPLDNLFEDADHAEREENTAATMVSNAARRAEDGDARTSSSVDPTDSSIQRYSEQLTETADNAFSDYGLMLQISVL